MNKVCVAAIQMSAIIGDLPSTRERAKKLIVEAADKGAGLCVLPELGLSEFFPQRKEQSYFSYAEDLEGETIREFCDLAKKTECHLVVPLFEKRLPWNYYNSAVLISDKGEVSGVYRKTHIPFTSSYEKYYFTPGNEFPVFETGLGRLGILICYDRRFPEAWRCLVQQGAYLIVNLIASWSYQQRSEKGIWDAELKTRAFENQVFVVAANRSGQEGEFSFIGRSMIVSPYGEIIAAADEEENVVVCAEIDLAEVEKCRCRIPLFRDRRSELYSKFNGC